MTLLSKLYPLYYTKKRKHYDSSWFPRSIAVFIPCKGSDPDFEENIRSVLRLRQEEKRLRVFFLVESESDTACPIIRRNLTEGSQLVIAGLAETCCQKNHSLLKGIEAAGEKDEVYLFMDNDSEFSQDQLKELLLPLSDPTVSASCGFQWNILTRKTAGERLHSFMIAIQWTLINQPYFKALWGGATAIKREDFNSIGAKQVWSRNIVDDMSLQSLFLKLGRKRVFVPFCINEKHQKIDRISKAIIWFKRQLLYTKFNSRPFWFIAITISLYPSLRILSLPVLLILTLFLPQLLLPAGITLLFVLITMLSTTLMKRKTKDNFHPLAWFFLSPLHFLLYSFSTALTLFTGKMDWAGVIYTVDKKGNVTDIKR